MVKLRGDSVDVTPSSNAVTSALFEAGSPDLVCDSFLPPKARSGWILCVSSAAVVSHMLQECLCSWLCLGAEGHGSASTM